MPIPRRPIFMRLAVVISLTFLLNGCAVVAEAVINGLVSAIFFTSPDPPPEKPAGWLVRMANGKVDTLRSYHIEGEWLLGIRDDSTTVRRPVSGVMGIRNRRAGRR